MSSVGRARRFVRELATEDVDDLDAVTLMTSELVSNVVRHTDSAITVEVTIGPPFRVNIHDGHAANDAFRALIAERPPAVAPTTIGGRGIGVVHALATRIGLDDDDAGGKVVWFEV